MRIVYEGIHGPVSRGKVFLPREARPTTTDRNLTPRESSVINQILLGKCNKDIAVELRITENTVKMYLSRIYEKLGVVHRHGLATWARKQQGYLLGCRPVE